MNSRDKERLDHVDHCMNYLGMSLNLADPTSDILSSKKDVDEHTVKMWNAVREDYRKLSDAIHTMRDKSSLSVRVPPWAKNGGTWEIE